MKAQLFLIDQNQQAKLLVEDLQSAESLISRGVGLLSRKSIQKNEALWFKPGNNFHTFFMRFPIDCIFLDSKLKVSRLYKNVKPFRFGGPVWKATSFIETAAGQIDTWNLKEGDQLFVVS